MLLTSTGFPFYLAPLVYHRWRQALQLLLWPKRHADPHGNVCVAMADPQPVWFLHAMTDPVDLQSLGRYQPAGERFARG